MGNGCSRTPTTAARAADASAGSGELPASGKKLPSVASCQVEIRNLTVEKFWSEPE
jgi:hypothetical protein